MRAQRTNFAPAMIAAVLLHGGLLTIGLIAWPWMSKPIPPSSAVAVTLVAQAPAPPRPAEEAPQPAPAASPEPAPEPVKPPPPAPAPKPAPPPPPTNPLPTPKPSPPPAKTKPQAAKPAKDDSLDLAALTSSLDKQAAKSDARKTPGVKGAPRPEQATVARLDPGQAEAATADAAAAVGARLNRIWNKACGVEGFRDITVQVRFNLTPDGAVEGSPIVLNEPAAPSAVWTAAKDRAMRAVFQAAPFRELPKQTYSTWRTFTAVFDAKEACKNL
jgi:outer membrane biosynthesis protein TonB